MEVAFKISSIQHCCRVTVSESPPLCTHRMHPINALIRLHEYSSGKTPCERPHVSEERIFHGLQPIIEPGEITMHYISCIDDARARAATISTVHDGYRVCKSEPFQSEFLYASKDIQHMAAIPSSLCLVLSTAPVGRDMTLRSPAGSSRPPTRSLAGSSSAPARSRCASPARNRSLKLWSRASSTSNYTGKQRRPFTGE